eukprot:1792063-Amphidinium_carterae.1
MRLRSIRRVCSHNLKVLSGAANHGIEGIPKNGSVCKPQATTCLRRVERKHAVHPAYNLTHYFLWRGTEEESKSNATPWLDGDPAQKWPKHRGLSRSCKLLGWAASCERGCPGNVCKRLGWQTSRDHALSHNTVPDHASGDTIVRVLNMGSKDKALQRIADNMDTCKPYQHTIFTMPHSTVHSIH